MNDNAYPFNLPSLTVVVFISKCSCHQRNMKLHLHVLLLASVLNVVITESRSRVHFRMGKPDAKDIQYDRGYKYSVLRHSDNLLEPTTSYEAIPEPFQDPLYRSVERFLNRKPESIPRRHGLADSYDNSDASYTFGYDVRDDYTNNIQGREETRNGHQVQGVYHLIDADGLLRRVTYGDDGYGFYAEIERTGEQHFYGDRNQWIPKEY